MTHIEIFLQHFHYLNHKGSRSGCLMFGNNGLTAELEGVAKKLRTDLTALNQHPDKSADEIHAEFFARIRESFAAAENLRVKHGKPLQPRKNPPLHMTDGKDTYDSRWVKPYKTGRFEKQLVAALNAVDDAIDEVALKSFDHQSLAAFKQECQKLAAEITTYQRPERAFVEVPNTRVEIIKPKA